MWNHQSLLKTHIKRRNIFLVNDSLFHQEPHHDLKNNTIMRTTIYTEQYYDDNKRKEKHCLIYLGFEG